MARSIPPNQRTPQTPRSHGGWPDTFRQPSAFAYLLRFKIIKIDKIGSVRAGGGALRSGQTSCADQRRAGNNTRARRQTKKGSGDQHAFPSGRVFYGNRISVGIHTKCTISRRKTRPRGATNTIPRPGERREWDVPRRRDGHHLATQLGALFGVVAQTQGRVARRWREGTPRSRA